MLQASARLRRLAHRATAPGVLAPAHLGVTLHALHQLQLFSMSDAALLETIRRCVADCDPRSQASALHLLALEARAQLDVHVAPPAALDLTLDQVQQALYASVDELRATDAVLVAEALAALTPFQKGPSPLMAEGMGTRPDLQSAQRLAAEVQARVLTVVSAVRRPVDLIALCRVVTAACRGEGAALRGEPPLASAGEREGGDEAVWETFGLPGGQLLDLDALAENNRPRASASATSSSLDFFSDTIGGQRGRHHNLSQRSSRDASAQEVEWWAEVQTRLWETVRGRLPSFDLQAYLSLLDALTVLGPSSALTSRSTESPLYTRAAALPLSSRRLHPGTAQLVGEVLTRVDKATYQLSPSQTVAWLLRVVHLRHSPSSALGRTADGLLLHLVRHLQSVPSFIQEELTISQLTSAASSLSLLLTSEVHRRQQQQKQQQHQEQQEQPPLVPLSNTDLDECFACYVYCFQRLHHKIEETYGRSGEESAAHARNFLLPLLLNLPENYLQQYVERLGLNRLASTPTAASPSCAFRVGSKETALLQKVATTIEASVSLTLRHYHTLMPRERVFAAVCALHWHLYHTPSLAELTATASAAAATADVRVNYMLPYYLTGLDETQKKRKLQALCGLLQSSVGEADCFSLKDVLQLFNALVPVLFVERGLGTASPHGTSTASSSPLLLPALCTELQARLRDELAADAYQHRQRHQQGTECVMDTLPLPHLCRYLNSLSKLGVRAKREYYPVLHYLAATKTQRPPPPPPPPESDTAAVGSNRQLGPFELLQVLAVMARHHLHSPSLLHTAVRRLPQLAQALTPSQKASCLKYLAQCHAQRFVRAPCFAPLEGGNFFDSADEVASLGFLDACFALHGLVELRQYESLHILQWLLVGPRAPLRQEAAVVGVRQVRSSTTLMELALSLTRLLPPADATLAAAVEAMLLAVLPALQQQLATSQTLFVDVARLCWYGPVVREVRRRGDRPQVAAAWAAVVGPTCLRPLVARRLVSIAADATLTPNTFLFGQLAAGVYLQLLPPGVAPHHSATGATKEDTRGDAAVRELTEAMESRLVHCADTRRLPQLLGNLRQLMDVVVVGLYLFRRAVCATAWQTHDLTRLEKAHLLLSFAKKHLPSLRVQELLSICAYTTATVTQLQTAEGAAVAERWAQLQRLASTGEGAAKKQKDTKTMAVATARVMLQLRAETKKMLEEDSCVPQLSPAELTLRSCILQM